MSRVRNLYISRSAVSESRAQRDEMEHVSKAYSADPRGYIVRSPSMTHST